MPYPEDILLELETVTLWDSLRPPVWALSGQHVQVLLHVAVEEGLHHIRFVHLGLMLCCDGHHQMHFSRLEPENMSVNIPCDILQAIIWWNLMAHSLTLRLLNIGYPVYLCESSYP
jgi:hypothetical protein